jgi:hypothetical protein
MKRLRFLVFLIIIFVCLFLLKSDVSSQPQTQAQIKIEQDISLRIENINFEGNSLLFNFDSIEDPYYISYIFNTFNKYFENNNMDIKAFLTITGVDKFEIIFNDKVVIYDYKKIVAYFALKKAEQRKFLQQNQ